MSGTSVKDYSPVEVDFKPNIEPKKAELLFDGMHAEQELGRPFLINLDMSSGEKEVEVHKLIGSTCSVWLYNAEGKNGTDTYFHGIVTRVVSPGLSGGAYRYKFEVRPWIWLLSQTANCCIFQNMSAFQIVTKVFRDAGFSDFEDKRQSGSGDIELEYCVQYRETSLAFVTRLMEQFGFYYYFKHAKDSHTLVIVDDSNAHEKVSDEIPFKFDSRQTRTVDDHIFVWSLDLNLNTGRWTYNDYNFETPTADLTAKTVKDETHQHGKLEIYEYPGPYDKPDHGQKLSDIRMQAIIRDRRFFTGESNSRRLLCGWRFKLKDHLPADLNVDYLITRSITTVSGAEGTPNPEAKNVDTYHVDLKGIPADKSFRLTQRTLRPVVHGPQTAKVVGKPGEEITTDKYGRIKVKFHWDHSQTADEDRTCWIRVAQTWAADKWGAIVIPRVGQEVVVEFLEGNPDRPLVTGVVYNATNMVPYPLPDNKTQSGFKTNSSQGGGGSNELRFEDKKGDEQVYLHAQKDWKREVEHDESTEVKNDQTIKVTNGNHAMTVAAGNHSTTVSAGNHKLDVSAGKSDITAAQSITLTVGGNSIKIDTSGITINGMKLDLQGQTTTSVKAGASMTLDGGGMLSASGGMIKLN